MWFSLALFVTLISAYKPPSVDNNTFTRELLNVLDNATRHSENILCVGDLNCDILHPTNGNKPWDSIFPFLLNRHFTWSPKQRDGPAVRRAESTFISQLFDEPDY